MGQKTLLRRTRFPGVEYYKSQKRRHAGKPDRCFYIRYTFEGKRKREKIGWLSEGYNAQAAQSILADRLRRIRHAEELPSKKALLTISKIAARYFEDRGPTLKGFRKDKNRWEKHLENSCSVQEVMSVDPA